MEAIKSTWGSLLGDPKFMRRVNGYLTLLWIAMIPISFVMHWLSSVTYVSALSLWALVSGHWSAWQAARVEVAQQKAEMKDTEGMIVKRIIKETSLHASKNGTRTAKRKQTTTLTNTERR